MNRLLIAATIATAAVTTTATAHAEHVDFTTQQCVQFDGTMLAEGAFVTEWPTEMWGANGYVMPPAATGTLLNGYPWPCGPATTPAEPEPAAVAEEPAVVVEVAAIAASTRPPAVKEAPAPSWLDELQAILVESGGW